MKQACELVHAINSGHSDTHSSLFTTTNQTHSLNLSLSLCLWNSLSPCISTALVTSAPSSSPTAASTHTTHGYVCFFTPLLKIFMLKLSGELWSQILGKHVTYIYCCNSNYKCELTNHSGQPNGVKTHYGFHYINTAKPVCHCGGIVLETTSRVQPQLGLNSWDSCGTQCGTSSDSQEPSPLAYCLTRQQ